MIDKPRDVRIEDELDVSKLSAYLRKIIDGLKGDLTIKQYSGGASNLTYLLRFENEELVLRCPPVGTKSKGAHDMAREFGIMSTLKPVYRYVPKMIHFCNDLTVIGREFYVMEKITGIIPRANLPKDLVLSPDQVRQMCLNVVDKLIEIHRIPVQDTDLMNLGKGQGYINRQISGWIGRYQKAKTWNVPSCGKVINWLQNNLPDKERICLIHNDFRFDNVVLAVDDPTKVISVLDWEMATIGDPLMDLGNSLAYWVQADDDWIMRSIRRQPTHLQGMLSRQEVINYYCRQMGYEPQRFTFYEVYGLFRLIVIIQQIYYRYHHNQTRNPAFKHFWLMVHYLNWRCKRIISKL